MMVIKNTNLSGTDWVDGYLLPVDLNDTFDKIDTIVELGN